MSRGTSSVIHFPTHQGIHHVHASARYPIAGTTNPSHILYLGAAYQIARILLPISNINININIIHLDTPHSAHERPSLGGRSVAFVMRHTRQHIPSLYAWWVDC